MSKNNHLNYYNFIVAAIALLLLSLIFGLLGGYVYDLTKQSETNKQSLVSEEKTIIKSQQEAVVEVVKQVSPSVVSIVASRDLPMMEERYFSPYEEDFFREFFGEDFQIEPRPREEPQTQEISSGSGFIVSEDGYIITNRHVVAYEDVEYTVLLNNEKSYTAQVIDRDEITDLAVLKIEAQDLKAVDLGESSNLLVGQTVIAIGNALGEFSNTVSTGVISGLSRSVLASGGGRAEQLMNVIQTDASINPGNSGGPLLDINGKVIGINTAIARGAQNIGFAIPVNELKIVINSVQETGEIVRPWLGVRYIIINDQVAKKNNLEIDYGALVLRGETREDLAVIPGSPADKAGLRENDIILEVNGEKVTSKQPLSYLISKYSPNESITLTILRQGEEESLNVVLGTRD